MTEPMFRFRTLSRFDSAYNIHVTRCLETGSVVTAEHHEVGVSMIRELLTDEVAYALKNNSLPNLLSNPAPVEEWLDFIALDRSPTVGVLVGGVLMEIENRQFV